MGEFVEHGVQQDILNPGVKQPMCDRNPMMSVEVGMGPKGPAHPPAYPNLEIFREMLGISTRFLRPSDDISQDLALFRGAFTPRVWQAV